MKLVITGSEGNVGRRLMQAFPGAIGLDRREDATIRADLATLDYAGRPIAAVLSTADALIHLATSADPDAADDVHWQAVTNTARLLQAAAAHGVKRVVLPSSDWAEPKNGIRLNAYGHSKRVIEAMAAMYSVSPGLTAVALRIGWVPGSARELDGAEDWLRANHWPDERLIAEVRNALGLTEQP